jgi:MoaA/NifB/PqqE/SkfB family radical SAM enzyme
LLKYLVNRITGRLKTMPVLVLMPHSRCNCKCVMCDIWKANSTARELTSSDLAPHIDTFRKLGVRRILLSGGEPLMHSNLWEFCRSLQTLNVQISLLSTGLLLRDHARPICETCEEVIVSLDGSREVHNEIRRIPHAYEKLEDGIAALREVRAGFRVTGRCVLQRRNYSDLFSIAQAARSLKLNQISFLTADVSSSAFNRPSPWSGERVAEIALDHDDVKRFEDLMEQFIHKFAADIQQGFIAESAEKLRRLPAYFAAIRGLREFPSIRCNAPWVSAVVEADGSVRPCFFHNAFGNIHEEPFEDIVNGDAAVEFRRTLKVASDPICRKCVCTLHLNPRAW